MASRKVLFGLLVLCISIYLTECGRFGGGRSSGRGSSRGGSSWGKGWGGSSSSSGSSWSKPSSSGSSWGSSGNSYKPSTSWNTGSSSSGSSWGSSGNSYKPISSWNTGSSSGSSSWNKPSYPSSSGLSGTGSGSHSYPSSSSGLSGSGSGSHSYPSSSSGLSGSGSGSHSYPSGTGLSGGSKYPSGSSGSGSHSYPPGPGLSGGGHSGSGSSKYPSSSVSHGYPSSPGLSGSGRGTHSHPPSYGNSHNNYPKVVHNSNSGYGASPVYIPHTYYTAPQHVYITQYRDSGSRYSDLLTGLTLYNMGRSHSHYHDHYYYDDYYRNRYTGNNNNYHHQNIYNRPEDKAVCTLRIKENENLEVMKIPCEIVSTFTEGGKKVESETYNKHTVCTTNITSTKTNSSTLLQYPQLTTFVSPNSTTETPINNGNVTANLTGSISNSTAMIHQNVTDNATYSNITRTTSSSHPTEVPLNSTVATEPILSNNSVSTTTAPILSSPIKVTSNTSRVELDGNVFTQTVKTITPTETIVNVTTCTTTQNYIDPLSVKDSSAIDPSKMECAVDIRTKEAHFRNTVECKTLMEYAKMPVPKKEDKPFLPPREKLKSWLQKPPWWMSMFIAV